MISTTITPKLVIHTATGNTDLTQITAATTAWYRHPQFDRDLPVLWDLREASFQPPTENLEAWTEANREMINAERAGRKTAWVLPDPEVAAFAVELLGDADWQHKVRIFHNDMEAAEAWLKSTIH